MQTYILVYESSSKELLIYRYMSTGEVAEEPEDSRSKPDEMACDVTGHMKQGRVAEGCNSP